MQLSELDFSYPEELVALQPSIPHRVMWVENGQFQEINIEKLLNKFRPGDVLVVNDSKVMPRRVFTDSGLEVLFLKELAENHWQVLMPLSRLKKENEFTLPGGIVASISERGRPQVITTSSKLDDRYFEEYGQLPLPPYIQKARGERKPLPEDKDWYQTAWAQKNGSLAAPTASLHFSQNDLQRLRESGVQVLTVTLHVGLGTFMEITSEDLNGHQMHHEEVEVSEEVWQEIQLAKSEGRRVWALGTTVTRTLESVARGMVAKTPLGYRGSTNLFLKPGSRFEVVDALLTNFHQPKSTLLALVGAFVGLDLVMSSYKWAIERRFHLFSYGDLTAWIPQRK